MTLSFVPSDGSPTWVFDGTNGRYVLEDTEGFFEAPVDLVIDQFTNSDGGALVSERRSPRPLLFRVGLFGDVPDEWGSLLSKLAAGGTFRYDNGSEIRELRGITLETPDRSESGHDLYDQEDGIDAFTVSLLALDPWWYGPTQTIVVDLDAITSLSFSPAQPYNAAFGYNGVTPQTHTIAGHGPASPRYEFRGGLSSLAVRLGDLGWTWQEALAGIGDAGTVDTRRGSRGPKLGAPTYSNDHGSLNWRHLTEDSRLFDLPAGDQDILIVAPDTTATAELTIFYEPRWLTP